MSPASTTGDPSLLALVPRPSPARNAVVASTGLALVLAVGWLGTYAQVAGESSEASSSLEPAGVVVEEHILVSSGWPGLRLTEIDPPVGARLTDAWLVPAATTAIPVSVSASELLSALVDVEHFTGNQPVSPGERYRLVLRLEITDCSAYTEDEAGDGPGDGLGPDPHATTVQLRTALGGRGTVELTAIGWTRDDVEQWSACP